MINVRYLISFVFIIALFPDVYIHYHLITNILIDIVRCKIYRIQRNKHCMCTACTKLLQNNDIHIILWKDFIKLLPKRHHMYTFRLRSNIQTRLNIFSRYTIQWGTDFYVLYNDILNTSNKSCLKVASCNV